MLDLLQQIAAFNFLLFTGLIWYYRKKLDHAIFIFSFFLLGKGLTMLSNLLLGQVIFPGERIALRAGVIMNSFLFFYAPFLYWFTLSVLKSVVPIRKFSIHLLPFTFFLLMNIALITMAVLEYKGAFFNNLLGFRNSIQVLYYAQVLGYTGVSLWMLYKSESKGLIFDKIVKWLKQVLWIFIAIWIVFFVSSLFGENQFMADSLSALGIVLILVLSNVTLFLILGSPEVFYNNLSVKLKKVPNTEIVNKQNYDKLCELVVSQKLYKNADLKIGDLSSAIDQSPRNVSALINKFYEGNFYDFVNYYRIEEAKSLLKNTEGDMTILTILYESGFNNKSVFNAVFKKMVGVTPSAFRKNHITTLYG